MYSLPMIKDVSQIANPPKKTEILIIKLVSFHLTNVSMHDQ